MRPRRLVIVGAGIAGLAAAARARTLATPDALHVAVIEKSERLGGCIQTQQRDGFLMELGAESLPSEKPWAVALAERVGLCDEFLTPIQETKGTLVSLGHRLKRVPIGFSPLRPGAIGLAAGGLLTPVGALRAAFERFVRPRASPEDESLSCFVTRRFGREALERLAQPFAAALYSADPNRLSMNAAFPQIAEVERLHGSILRAPSARSAPTLLTLKRGLGSLVDALATRIEGVTFHARTEVVSVQPHAGADSSWSVSLRDGRTLDADAVICAVPAPEAARLCSFERRLTTLLGSIRYASLAVVTLAFTPPKVPGLPRAHGVLIPRVERKHITAVTFSSEKYAGRAPDGAALVRAYVGGASNEADLAKADDDLVRIVRDDLRKVLGIVVPPAFSHVRRWNGALPQYDVGHLQRVGAIEDRTRPLRGFALAGAAYRGVGVSECVRSGEAAADSVASDMLLWAQLRT